MKTKILLTISFFLVSVVMTLAQSNNNARNAPLPGEPVPLPPPGCIPPAVPVVTTCVSGGQTLTGLLCWKAISGAIGYNVYVTKNGSTTANLKATLTNSSPHAPGVFSCVYEDMAIGSYKIYVQSYNSGCTSSWSNAFPVTIVGPPVPQNIDPGNDPYALDLGNLQDYISKNERVATSSAIKMYVNATSGTLNVSLPFESSTNAKFLVNDINGRVIELPISTSAEGNTQLETSGMSPGIYILTVISGHNSFKKKFVKN
jgi:hypothetical protein